MQMLPACTWAKGRACAAEENRNGPPARWHLFVNRCPRPTGGQLSHMSANKMDNSV